MSGVDHDDLADGQLRDRVARAALSAVVEPGTVDVAHRVLAVGADATWQAVVRGDDQLDQRRVLHRRANGVDGRAVLDRAAELGLRYVCPGDADWPPALTTMRDTLSGGAEPVPPPFGLWLRGAGTLATCGSRAVAVVGARAASPYGTRVASDLATDLALRGWTVVSGAAYGVDAAAHRGALSVGGGTHAVLACGLDMVYPRTHGELLERIAAAGLVISELPPGMEPFRSRFIARNRIIAALSAGTVVVEAARRSGALNTASWTGKLSREVMAVPGPVTSRQSTGCHEWIRDRGATLVTDADEVADVVGRLGDDAAPLSPRHDRPLDRLPPDVRYVYERLPAHEATTVPELAGTSGYPAQFVESALHTLADAGLVDEALDGWSRIPGAADPHR